MDSNLRLARRFFRLKCGRFPHSLMGCSSPAAKTSSFAWTFESKSTCQHPNLLAIHRADVLRSLIMMTNALCVPRKLNGALLGALLAIGIGALALGDVPQQKIDSASGWPTWRGPNRDNIS